MNTSDMYTAGREIGQHVTGVVRLISIILTSTIIIVIIVIIVCQIPILLLCLVLTPIYLPWSIRKAATSRR